MFFFGWGTKNKTWPIVGSDKYLVATWSHFHIFLIPIGYGIKWHIIGDSRSEDVQISYDKVKEMFPENTPKVHIFQKYGLIIFIGALWLLSFFIV